MNWHKKNRIICGSFVMLGIFCITLTLLGINVAWTAAIFFALAFIVHWFAKITKGD